MERLTKEVGFSTDPSDQGFVFFRAVTRGLEPSPQTLNQGESFGVVAWRWAVGHGPEIIAGACGEFWNRREIA